MTTRKAEEGMCARYTLTVDLTQLQQRFSFVAEDLPYVPRYNVAPTQQVLALINEEDVQPAFLRWGLIPSWARDSKIGNRMINARAETVAEKPSFRRALARRRCLVLSDGFYEWRAQGGKKTPVRVVLKSGEPFAFAGLWETWRPRGGEAIRSCTIITTEPNSFMEPIHNRMPVILTRDSESAWLDRGIEDAELLTGLLAPYPSEEMAAYQVSTGWSTPRGTTCRVASPHSKARSESGVQAPPPGESRIPLG